MKKLLLLFTALTLMVGCVSQKAETNFKSPDGGLFAKLNMSESGIASFTLLSGSDTISANSIIGIKLKEDSLDFSSGLTLIDAKFSQINEKYEMPTGKVMQRQYICNEMEYLFKNSVGAEIVVRARLFDDSFSFRYELKNSGKSEVVEEYSLIDLSSLKNSWLLGYRSADEGEFEEYSDLSTINKKVLSLPLLVENSNKTVMLITEADVRDYPIACGYIENEGVRVGLPTVKGHHDGVSANFISPWRVIIAGDSFGDIVSSQVVDHLAKPTELEDISWIKSGINTFPWWANPDAQNRPDKMKEYIDFAAEMGWPYIEFDVALIGNEVHSRDEWKNTPYVKEIVDYAKSKGVACFGWEDIKKLQSEEKRKEFFEEYKRLGLVGCKVDFVNSYSQRARRAVEAVAREAADHKLMISFHGAQSPRGLARTYPNIMTFEAVKGSEYYISINRSLGISPKHNCTIPFTRNVLGSMDYTPSALSAKNRTTSAAHELALSVVFESGWQGMCDYPDSYRANPLIYNFLKKIHASWDETTLVDGYPGKYCVMKRRRGDDTFIAGINNGEPRTLYIEIPKGKEDNLILLVDGENGVESAPLTIKDGKLTVTMDRNGDFVIY